MQSPRGRWDCGGSRKRLEASGIVADSCCDLSSLGKGLVSTWKWPILLGELVTLKKLIMFIVYHMHDGCVYVFRYTYHGMCVESVFSYIYMASRGQIQVARQAY